MKVSELKKGMLVKCISPKHTISASNFAYGKNDVKWANVVSKKRSLWARQKHRIETADVAMYIGTKKDVKVSADWSDKFILLNGNIVAVDPAAWRKLTPVDEQS